MAGRREPSPRVDDPGEEERDRRILSRLAAVFLGGTFLGGTLREEEGGCRLNREAQGGGGASPYRLAAPPGGGGRRPPEPRDPGRRRDLAVWGAAMAGRGRPSPRVDDPGEEERDRRILSRLAAVFLGGTLREEEGGCRLNREAQGGGGASPYRFGGASGRRREAAAGTARPREEEGVSPYLVGGILREEEGGCRLNPDPREEEWVGCSMPYLDPQAAS
ncbi:hypothetical protein [Paracoccus binzhouensis]|uniref:hypothetical protein n=1 Tax=Paracoccus binzhouensis TaxID=2796149 RepID=UPI0018EF22DB|nr:hypothetical protein [Paracoccus binzhouensis]